MGNETKLGRIVLIDNNDQKPNEAPLYYRVYTEDEMSFETEFLMKPAYDYTNYLVTEAPIPSGMLIKNYILEEAQDGRFD